MKTRRGAAKKVKRASEQTPDFRHRGKTSGGGHFQGASVFREMQALLALVFRLTGREPRIAARRPRTLPPARRHAQRAGLLVVADRVVDARVVVRLTLGEGVEAAAALDGHELERRLDERLGFSCR